MRILINAINLKVGGGITVLVNFLNHFIENRYFHDHKILILVPGGFGYKNFDFSPLDTEEVPRFMNFPFLRLFLDHLWLKNRITQFQPNVLFTMGNFAVPTDVNQAVVFMWPYGIYPKERGVYNKLNLFQKLDLRLRLFVFESRLKYADIILPQTETSKSRLLKLYEKKLKKVEVIPTAFSKIGYNGKHTQFIERSDGFKYLVSLTRYYGHKNLEILIPLATLIRENNAKFKLVITLDESQGKRARVLLKSIKQLKLEEIIINLGPIPYIDVPSLYSQVDALLMPTLLESFSATYIDSMQLGVPIFTSDRDFARDVCGEAAFYFNPFDPADIYNTLMYAFNSETNILNVVNKGKIRANNMLNWNQVTFMYLNTLIDLGKRPQRSMSS